MAYTNVTRILGLSSGMDTEALVTQLMNAETMKLNRYKRNAITISWKQEAYRGVYHSLKNFQAKHLNMLAANTLRLPSTFKAKTTTVKTSAGEISSAVTAGADAKDGKYSVKVDQLAAADMYEGKIRIDGDIRSAEAFDVKDILKGDAYSVTLDGVTKTISVQEGDEVPGGTITFGDDGISVKASNGEVTPMTEEQFIDALNGKLKKAFGTEGTAGEKQKVEAKINKEGGISLFTNGYHSHFSIANVGEQDSLTGLGLEPGSASKFDASRTLGDIFGSGLLHDDGEIIQDGEWGSFTINGKAFAFEKETTLDELIKKVNDSDIGVTLSYDEYNGVFKLESSQTGVANQISLSGGFLTDTLGLGTEAKRKAADAVATISDGSNTVTVTRGSNTFDMFGADWTLNETTNEALTVTVARDADNTIGAIKGFVDSYNELIAELNGLSRTARPKGESGSYYEPLLAEEKASMTETQISNWEEQAKKGILNRDSLISGISSQMRDLLYQPVQMEDGSSLSLYQIGVTTSADWREYGKLVVDENKLREAIELYGDDIATLFTKTSQNENKNERLSEEGLANRVNDIINNAIGTYGTIASKAGIDELSEMDNELYYQLKSENEKINSLIDSLTRKETYYYNMFAKMEAAMAQSNSQISYLMSITGGN